MKKKLALIRVIVAAIFFVTFAGYLVTSIVLKSYNVSLLAKQNALQDQILQVQVEVDTLNTQVTALQEKNRVMNMIDSEMNGVHFENIIDLTGH
jgi:hypothetical protein